MESTGETFSKAVLETQDGGLDRAPLRGGCAESGGGRPPNPTGQFQGAMLVSLLGTGRRLLARVTAGEASVPFITTNGSEFLEMLVGVGQQGVVTCLQWLQKNAPCILLINEIDFIGGNQGQGHRGAQSEQENTLNQMLVEMDSERMSLTAAEARPMPSAPPDLPPAFCSRELPGVRLSTSTVVLTGTSCPDVLDPALTQLGLSDHLIHVGDMPVTWQFLYQAPAAINVNIRREWRLTDALGRCQLLCPGVHSWEQRTWSGLQMRRFHPYEDGRFVFFSSGLGALW
ncbi:ATP-dependent zinc metalloprotease FtsH-like isoform X3 [Meles meles]|uniref:ATP-dependent zinc metalloprotease FtsH-like isoform X2 n=1 Tax=Meles meles TaxID=9662 RepID=UPI001E69BA20|nr:ATP-dependent zinc metalloprotease FtsH-like isoform X2 [Meles meles]XP_045843139.1 ATP-dependent zinc metalloprotease FtsH-like isoform X3 [Meles meles]